MSEHELHFRYTPGSFTGVCGGDVAALVGLPPDHELIQGVLDLVRDAEPHLDDVLEVLTSRGLRAVSDFVLAELLPDAVRVVVRGNCTATTSSGESVAGAGLWVDRTVPGDHGVRLAGGDVQGSYLMPVGLGIVLAGVIEAGKLQASAAAPAAPVAVAEASAVAAEPEPKAEPAAPVTEAATEPEQAAQPQPVEPEEEVPSFDHLFGATQNMSLDDLPPEAQEADSADVAELEQAPLPDAPEHASTAAPALTMPTPLTTPVPPPPPPAAPANGGFIDFFPWAEDGTPLPHPDSGSSAPEAPAPSESPLAAPVEAPAPAASEPHEMTVSRNQLRGTGAPLVVAARCPQGHLSPAYAGTCRVCRQQLPPQQPFEVERPPLGVLRLSNGESVLLDRGAVLGRNPHLPPDWTGEQPNLIRLTDPNRDISSQHVEVRLDFWHVLVRDLGSTNGTDVILPGADPVALRPMDAMTIEPGTRVILAGVFEFTYEV